MSLNCKVGDLAVKVRADEGDEIPLGAIVECVSYEKGAYLCGKTGKIIEEFMWNVKFRGEEFCKTDGIRWACFDEYLRPIRDEEGEDETLTWAPSPLLAMTE